MINKFNKDEYFKKYMKSKEKAREFYQSQSKYKIIKFSRHPIYENFKKDEED